MSICYQPEQIKKALKEFNKGNKSVAYLSFILFDIVNSLEETRKRKYSDEELLES